MTYADLAAPVEAALRATRDTVLTAYRTQPGPAEFKQDGSAVPDLDRELESTLGDALMALDPSFGLVGEETGEIRAGSPTWHLDPVDGTANFARRVSIFGSQVVLIEGTTPLAGFAAITITGGVPDPAGDGDCGAVERFIV